MAGMTRRVPPALRGLSGALMVCALMLCLTGLARPAMAMPASMQMTSSAAAGEAAGGHMSADAARHAGSMTTHVPDRGRHCPMIEQQCASPEAVLAQHGGVAPALAAGSRATALCPPETPVAQPNAPPAAKHLPDLHQLCVLRT